MVKSVLASSRLSLLFRMIVGIVFLVAAVPKIADPFVFGINIRNYHLIPDAWSNLVAIILPWIEFYTGIFLILGLYLRTSACLLAGLLGFFILAISSAIWRGFDISCGCFSTSADAAQVGISRIIEDLILLVMTIQILLVKKHPFSLERAFRKNKKK